MVAVGCVVYRQTLVRNVYGHDGRRCLIPFPDEHPITVWDNKKGVIRVIYRAVEAPAFQAGTGGFDSHMAL